MTDRAIFKKHAALLDDMTNIRGIDLEARALAGDISIDEITDAVFACTNCSAPGSCSKWLKQNAAGSKTSPDYCENTDLMSRFAAE